MRADALGRLRSDDREIIAVGQLPAGERVVRDRVAVVRAHLRRHGDEASRERIAEGLKRSLSRAVSARGQQQQAYHQCSDASALHTASYRMMVFVTSGSAAITSVGFMAYSPMRAAHTSPARPCSQTAVCTASRAGIWHSSAPSMPASTSPLPPLAIPGLPTRSTTASPSGNAQTVSARLRVLADDILYHRYPTRFNMDKQLGALEKIARQHPDNPVGHFCAWHFSRIARVLHTQRPLYARDLMADKERRLPLLPALKNYLSLKSPALRNAARISVMLSVASLMGNALHLPKPYWILMTVLFVTQNGYGATRVRIVHRAAGTLAGLTIAGLTLHFHVPESYTLSGMLLITLLSYLIIRKHYGWAMVGFTVTAVYTLQLLTLNGEQFIIARLIDTLIGCLIAFGGMVWLWPQWQSGLLKKNAHDALEADQQAIRLILSADPKAPALAYQRMRVNQAHNALYNSLNQAMQEPGFNTHYLEDMKLWVTHSQFIVEHINAMTTLAREHTMLTPDLAQRYLESCEIALQRCQQRLDSDGPGSAGDANIMESPESEAPIGPLSTLEQHLQRILGHLNTMHTISSVAWRQRPHHGIWLRKINR